eukprot:1341704-Amphidinium_carterae.1
MDEQPQAQEEVATIVSGGDQDMEESAEVADSSSQMFQCWHDTCVHGTLVTKKGSDEVRLSDIPDKDMPGFHKARASERHKMMYEHQGLLPFTEEESAWV